jgi:outer membrane protein
MKQLQKLFIASILFFGVQQANAQAKTAHVDVREIMSKMPQMVEAQKQLETLGKTYDTEFDSMVAEYRSKLEKYEAEAPLVKKAGDGAKKVVSETKVEDVEYPF